MDSIKDLTQEKISSSNRTDKMSSLSPSSNSTYEKYIGLVEKVLKKSRSDLDTTDLIRLAYGDDTAPYGGDEMLAEIMDGVLDNLVVFDKENGSILPQFKDKCEQQRRQQHMATDKPFQQRLNFIDVATKRVIQWEAKLEDVEKRDKITSQNALVNALLAPSSSTGVVTVEEIVTYREYQDKLTVQKQLLDHLAQIEDEADRLQTEYETRKSQIQTKLMELDTVEKNLEAAADACSMGFVHLATKM